MPAPTKAIDLCCALIRCPSVTPADGGSLLLLEELLKSHGFTMHRLTFSAPDQPAIDNLYARIGTGRPYLVFAGHTDVVPVGDRAAWRYDPFSAELADDMIWGRGAGDMKGAIAAFTAAALDFIAKHGSRQGLDRLPYHRRRGRPRRQRHGQASAMGGGTRREFRPLPLGRADQCRDARRHDQDRPARLAQWRDCVEGKQGHVAYPQRADNPVPGIFALADRAIATPLDPGTAHFDASNLEFTSVDVGNQATNVIPAKARARFNIRFNDLWTPDTLAAEIERRCAAGAGPARSMLSFEPCNALAFVTEPDHFTTLVANAIEEQTGRKPVLSTSGGTSDARFIRSYCRVVEFGLVGATMHMVDERVAVTDIAALTAIYCGYSGALFWRQVSVMVGDGSV